MIFWSQENENTIRAKTNLIATNVQLDQT